MWNIFKKKQDNNDNQKMGMLQSLAMKKAMKMSPQERDKMMQDMTKPENKDKLLSAMKMMKKTGMLSDEQMEEAKKRLGL
jgi:hypothetical protein